MPDGVWVFVWFGILDLWDGVVCLNILWGRILIHIFPLETLAEIIVFLKSNGVRKRGRKSSAKNFISSCKSVLCAQKSIVALNIKTVKRVPHLGVAHVFEISDRYLVKKSQNNYPIFLQDPQALNDRKQVEYNDRAVAK